LLEVILESYIIRIYRSEDNNPRNILGVVEEVGAEEKRAFTNIEELWNILNHKYLGGGGDEQGSFGRF
jgi:hypothetical protein